MGGHLQAWSGYKCHSLPLLEIAGVLDFDLTALLEELRQPIQEINALLRVGGHRIVLVLQHNIKDNTQLGHLSSSMALHPPAAMRMMLQ